jgi:hypothetical protein
MDTLASFHQALLDLRAEIEQTKAERARAQQQVEASDRHLEKLDREYQGIESWLRRHERAQPVPVGEHEREPQVEAEPEVQAKETPSAPADGWDINRIEAVSRVLVEAGEPLSPADIVAALARVGRDDSVKDVAAALTHLKIKRHRAENVSRGRWVATTQALEGAWGDEETGEDEEVSTTTMH